MAKTLNQLTSGLKQLENTEAVRRTNNSYALNPKQEIIALSLSGSQLESLKLDEKDAALEYLYLAGNESLTEVVFEGKFPNLTHLNIRNNALHSVTLAVHFPVLRQLYLQNNKLEEVLFPGDYSSLELLDISENELAGLSIPAGLTRLKYLYLGKNRLKKVELPEALKELQIVSLKNNQLKGLPQDTILSGRLEALYAAGNAPKDMPKVFLGDPDSYVSHNCLEDARIWFKDLKDHLSEKNEVVKLMLTGNGDTGKTSLLCALKNGKCEHDHPSTHGIEIDALSFPGITYNVWDFGGQEVYHGTHRLFISWETLQVILFDPKNEASARKSERVKDRIRDDQVWNYPIAYWFETNKELSPESQFFIVQNKKDEFEEIDDPIYQYAKDQKATFIHLSARTGENIDDLMYFLRKKARELPDFEMCMPQSWLKVRQFFIDNLQAKPNQKLVTQQEFDELCRKYEVRENTQPLLLKYLHHSGFLYHHSNLGDHIIADQRWALAAIYKPLSRAEDHYEEFKDNKGIIRVYRLFQVFGEDYTKEEKWLFLSFMESCGLCFQLNDRPWSEERSERDIYVFPEFLPAEKPPEVKNDWATTTRTITILRHRMPWLNYFVIQSFITALGRKTETKNIWRNGIHVSTPEGWFKVELDYDQKALLLYIEQRAMNKWLEPILEELKIRERKDAWEISTDGKLFQPFDLENWKQRNKELPFARQESVKAAPEKQPLQKGLQEVKQEIDRQLILFVAANPPTTGKLGSQEKEHSKIVELTRGQCDVIDVFTASGSDINNAISRWKPNVLHYCGHADQEGIEVHDSYKRGGRVLDKKTLGLAFESIKADFPQLELVFLNACFSRVSAQAISRHEIYALGTTDEIHSTLAIHFAEGFYFQYALSGDVLLSIRHGLRQVQFETGEDARSLIHLYHNGDRIAI